MANPSQNDPIRQTVKHTAPSAPLRMQLAAPRSFRRMQIAFVADCLDGHMGGGMVSANRFVQGLAERSDVTILGTGVERPDRIRLPAIRLPGEKLRDMGFTFAYPQREIVRRAVAHADVVHLQYPFWLSFAALREARRLHKPVVAALHVQPENLLYNIGVRSSWAASRLFRFWVERYYNRADLVVCPTEFAAQKAREHGLTTPICIVSNGFSPHVKPRAFPREPQHLKRFVILSLGRYGAEKRQDVLLRALSLSRYQDRISVVMGGAGPLEGKLRRQAARLRVPVELGFVSPERLPRLLNTADLFVHTSEVELEGMAVLDAMSVGLPAVIAESAQSAASGFALDARFAFPAGDPRALAERIDALIECPETLEAARGAARDRVSRFQLASSVDTLENAYRTLLKEPRLKEPRLEEPRLEEPHLEETRTQRVLLPLPGPFRSAGTGPSNGCAIRSLHEGDLSHQRDLRRESDQGVGLAWDDGGGRLPAAPRQ